MKIQTKLIAGASTLVITVLAATSIIVGYTSAQKSKEALMDVTTKQLESTATLTAEGIENFFKETVGQIQVMSSMPALVEQTRDLKKSYYSYHKDAANLPDKATQKQAVRDYYQNQFGKKYQDTNDQDAGIDRILSQLDDNTIALQYQYIAANSNPLGSKDELNFIRDNTQYSQVHKDVHIPTRNFLKHFGFYDIFIADIKTGDIIYSVYKELDYATSLLDGPYANTGIGEVFRKAQKATDTDDVFSSDFASYYPSYSSAASFLASPIYSGSEKIGVLIFQMPVEYFINYTTHHQSWETAGLRTTGESVLVGTDKKLRTPSRELLENKQAFIKQLKELNVVDAKTLEKIDKHNTNALAQTLDNPAVTAALNGKKGITSYTKYTGQEVLSAYRPVKIEGVEWALITEMNIEEATAEAQALVSQIVWIAIAVSLIAIILSVISVIVFARILVKPLNQTIDLMEDLAKGDGDLTARLQGNGQDEIGVLSRCFNDFIEKIQTLMIQVEEQSATLSASSSVMSEVSTDNREGAKQQRQSTQAVSHSMNEMSIAANEVAQSASSAEQAASLANNSAMEGSKTVETTTDAIQKLAANVKDAVDIIRELETTSDNIGSVVGVINSIAEQTNLLALNAAIEAARAGEQGRGFAVVADEVRALASRTQESTLEINNIIEQLQQNANSAVGIMNNGHKAVTVCVDEAEKAKLSLHSISQQIADITNMNLRIATSAEEQSAVGETMNDNIAAIDKLAENNTNSADIVLNKSNEINQAAQNLNSVISQFKLR